MSKIEGGVNMGNRYATTDEQVDRIERKLRVMKWVFYFTGAVIILALVAL